MCFHDCCMLSKFFDEYSWLFNSDLLPVVTDNHAFIMRLFHLLILVYEYCADIIANDIDDIGLKREYYS